MSEMRLNDNELSHFGIAKSYTNNDNKINSLDFYHDGKHLVTAGDDDAITIYDSENGKRKQTLYSKKYGVQRIRYTHNTACVLYASTKVDDALRYQSLHDNKYIRYFQGHTDKVTSLCMSPIDDTFFSSSKDKTVRLWDLRSPHTQGLLRMQKNNSRQHKPHSAPVVAIDPEAVIFAVAYNDYQEKKGMIKLYDKNSFDGGPFSTFKITMEDHYDWKEIKFSPDGKHILCTTNGHCVYLVDAYEGHVTKVFRQIVNARNDDLQAGFTPDVQWAWACGSDGTVSWYKVGSNPTEVSSSPSFKWRPHDIVQSSSQESICGPIYAAQFNPLYCMFASAGTSLNLWIPDTERVEK